jgi:hypothetical protein
VFWFLRWEGVLLGLFFIVFLLANEAGDAILAEIKRNFQRECSTRPRSTDWPFSSLLFFCLLARIPETFKMLL